MTLLRLEADAALPFLGTCTYCHDVCWPSPGPAEEWIPAEEYYRRGGTVSVHLNHCICPTCHHQLMERLRAQPAVARRRPAPVDGSYRAAEPG